jgi:hypothetical protein
MISKALASRLRQTALLLVAIGTSWMTPTACAQATGTAVDQTVDQVEVFSINKLLRLKYDPAPTKFVGLTATPTSNLRACQSSNVNGLFCLDGQVVRNWPTTVEHLLGDPITADNGTALFSCLDGAFGFAAGNPCTAMTVDVKGNVWVAGQKPDLTFSLMKVAKKVDVTCPSGTPTQLLSAPNYCFGERASNRARITDLSPVEGALVAQYFTAEGEGVVGVEGGVTVTFYPYDFTKSLRTFSSWPEIVQSAAILQRQETSGPLQTYVLITGASGKVWYRNLTTPGADTVFVHANATAAQDGDGILPVGAAACSGGFFANQFRVRASETSGRVFVTNRNYCLAYVLTPLPGLAGIDTSPGMFLPVSTTTSYPPDGLAVAPGVAINVAQCTGGTLADLGGCDLLGDSNDGNNYPAVRMYQVKLEPGSPVEGIPDCRYILKQIPLSSLPADHPCRKPGVVVNDPKITDGTQNFPQRQYLNVTPMLPVTVTDLFDASEKKPLGLPKLLVQPRYRAQAINSYTFEALFGVADPNIRFRQTFTVEFDVGDFNLAGFSLGCGVHQTVTTDHPNGPLPFNQWDIVTMVSERYASVGGPKGIVKDTIVSGQPYAAEHVDTMINKECYNPTPSAGTRWSMYNYNLELAEDKPVKSTSKGPVTGFVYSKAVKYLGNLLLSLHTELGAAQDKLACANVDYLGNSVDANGNPNVPASSAPLPSGTCTTLKAKWTTAQNALKKCAGADDDTGTSYPSRNCGDFYTAFLAYQTLVKGLLVTGDTVDPANRAGELWSRTDVIEHVFTDHFKKAWELGPAIANAQYLPGTP